MLAERRALIVGMVGTVVAGATARVVGRDGGLVGSVLPLASPPTPLPATPAPRPVQVQTPNAQVPSATPPPPTPVVAATPEALPNPPLPRKLARDKDGSLTAAGRPKGQLAPPITSNEDFYVVTKNAVGDPVVDANSWRLIVDGEVNRAGPGRLPHATLAAHHRGHQDARVHLQFHGRLRV